MSVNLEQQNKKIKDYNKELESLKSEILKKESFLSQKEKQINKLKMTIDEINKKIERIPLNSSGIPINPKDHDKLGLLIENIDDADINIARLDTEVENLKTEIYNLKIKKEKAKENKKDTKEVRDTAEKAQMVGQENRFKKITHFLNKNFVRRFKEDIPKKYKMPTLAALVVISGMGIAKINNDLHSKSENPKNKIEKVGDNKKTISPTPEPDKNDTIAKPTIFDPGDNENQNLDQGNNKDDNENQNTDDGNYERYRKHKKWDSQEDLVNDSDSKNTIESDNSSEDLEYYKQNPTSLPGYNPQGKFGFRYNLNGREIVLKFSTNEDNENAKDILDVHYMDNQQ